MAYIYLDDLKKILPGILDSWIDEDDESWEWIFSEIEQKCRIGKKEKKKKKFDKEEHIRRNRVDIDALINKFQQMDKDLKQAINNNTQLGLSMKDMGAEIRHIRDDVKAAKSMAEIAKNRTEVDYTKPKITYRQWEVCRKIIRTCERNGATKEELEQLDLIMSKYIPTSNNFSYADGKTAKEVKEIIDCLTCKHYCGENPINEPCIACDEHQCWEAKNGESNN